MSAVFVKPIRTALFAPGTKERIMTKALESGADAVIPDLEDSVPIASKIEARDLVAKAISGAAVASPWTIYLHDFSQGWPRHTDL